ncbi:MAG: hypothetical protein FJW26_14775 [Acidimicrobiia bacterium]|nr:hypothetical protein [Acidimicrobiia bacterium]
MKSTPLNSWILALVLFAQSPQMGTVVEPADQIATAQFDTFAVADGPEEVPPAAVLVADGPEEVPPANAALAA